MLILFRFYVLGLSLSPLVSELEVYEMKVIKFSADV